MTNEISRRPDPRVLEAMRPYFSEHFGNASSQSHAYGEEAHAAVEAARHSIAALIGAPCTRGIIFTSGGAESDVLAVHGALEAVPRGHPARWVNIASGVPALFRRPVDVVHVPAASLTELERALQPVAGETAATTLVSFRVKSEGNAANLPAISAMATKHGALLHVAGDTCSFQVASVDLLSIDGQTLGTPPGVGVLCVRRRSPPLRLQAQVPGGGQESGLRGGTLNVPGIVGLGAAATFAHERRSAAK